MLLNKKQMTAENVYRSALTPKPGPGGGSVREVSPPAGSQEKRPLLWKKGREIHLDVPPVFI